MKRKTTKNIICISSQTVATTVPWNGCGATYATRYTSADFDLKIRRAGTEDFCVAYCPMLVDPAGVTFYWDDVLYDLPLGRYDAVLFINDKQTETIDIELCEPSPLTARHITSKEEGCADVC